MIPGATALLLLIAFVAFAVEVVAGFGGTVITVTLASFVLPVADILAAVVPVNIAMSTFIVGRNIRRVDSALLIRRVLPLMGVGVLAGMLLFRSSQDAVLKAVFGAFVVVVSAIELRRGAGPGQPLATVPRAVALVVAGILHGLLACGGPMLVYVLGREVTDKGVFRATLSAVWLVFNTTLLVGYAHGGTLTRESLTVSAMLLVPLVGGIVVGEWVHGKLDAVRFRTGVFTILAGAGGALVLQALVRLSWTR